MTALVLAPASARAVVVVSYSPTTGLLLEGDGAADGMLAQGQRDADTLVVAKSGLSNRGIAPAALRAGPGCRLDDPRVLCARTGAAVITARLGEGADHLTLGTNIDGFVNGGGGNDILRGGRGGDLIEGGPGNDELRAGAEIENGFENLPRDDDLRGGDGDDRFTVDGAGTSRIQGGNGSDTLEASATRPSADLFDGGPGTDTADYTERGAAVTLRLSPQATAPDDGQPGEGDDLDNVERLIGGRGADTLEVRNSPLALTPRTTWSLSGMQGSDTLRVFGDIRSSLDGGVGTDTVTGGSTTDTIFSRDGELDTLSCGAGLDTVTSDLPDPVGGECENVNDGEVTEGRHVRFPARARVRSNGTLSVRLRCPRVRGGCRGRLDVRLDRGGTAFGNDTRYRIRPGRAATVTVRLPARHVARARRSGARVRLRSVERGIHGKPRTTIRSLRTRRG